MKTRTNHPTRRRRQATTTRRTWIARRVVAQLVSGADEALDYAHNLTDRHRDFWNGYKTALHAVASALALNPEFWLDEAVIGARNELDMTAAGNNSFESLTDGERRVFLAFAQDPSQSTRDVARTLSMTPSAVNAASNRARKKLGLKQRAQFYAYALANNLIQP